MRPIRLTLNAFGPFAGREVVDFTAALDAGIFGIYGDTGAGKTTIFDGIAFALFGQSSGAERVSDDMLSHYADPKEITFVELVFDLGNKRYVVRRIPRQERASNRGEGTTLQVHEAYLFDATGLSLDKITENNHGDLLAEKKTSLVDPMIKELLGYDAAQFRQIVLLPQGEFRKILTASSDERSPILKRLFDVSLYESFVQKIRNQATTMHRTIKDEQLRKNTMLEGITEDELKEDINSREKTIAELEDNLKVLVIQASAHQKAFTAGEALIEKFTSLADAKASEDKFKSETGTIKTYEARVANGRSALTVLPTEKLKNQALQELSEASKQLIKADNTFDSVLKNHDETKANLQQATGQQPEYDAATEKVQKLNRWQTILDKVAVLQAPVNESKLALKTVLALEQEAKDVVVESQVKLDDLQLLQQKLPEHIKAEADAKTAQIKLKQEAETTGLYETSLLKRDQQAGIVTESRDTHLKAVKYREECQNIFSQAEQELTDIQALHVARKLVVGEPCLVCGSIDHPHPAAGDPERLGRHESFEASEKLYEDARDIERERKGLVTTAEAILTDRQQELNLLVKPERGHEVLVPLLITAKSTLEKLEKDKRFNDLSNHLNSAENANKDAEKNREKISKDVAKHELTHSRALTALTTTESEIPEKWRNNSNLADAILSATREKDQFEEKLAIAIKVEKTVGLELASVKETQRYAKSSFTKMEIKSQQAAESFDKNLKISKLSVDGYEAAKTDVTQLEEIEEAIQSHNIKVASNKDRLSRLVKEIDGQEPPNLALLQSIAKKSGDKLEVGQADKTRLATELKQKRKIFASVIELSGKLLELEKKFAPLGEISNLASGENDLKVRLPDFAIAAMFDEILEATNLRLGPMTNQRYRLHRPAETTGGRKKRGLEISVFDAYTEKSRSTSSLSGGEGFQASLALALGLSDVVQQNSGGIKLDTIFIDEGFGTLDQETLDTALDTLCSLTGEMRVVGLISHTEQVKNLITEGFDIEMTPSGSHIHARKSTIL